MIRVVLLIALVALGRVACAQASPSVEDLLARAESAVAQAEATGEPREREALLDEAIASYRALLDAGVRNASVHRNIGTAFVLKGDLGRAVASFRRAERIDPLDPRVRDSLASARAMVRSEVSRGARTKAVDGLFFWRGLVPRSVLLWVGVAGWVVLWIGLTARVLRARPGFPGIGLAAVGAAVCVLTLGSLAGERAMVAMNPVAVIVDDGVVGYRGPSEGVYEPTFNEPIRAGVEGAVVERREGWVRLRLRSGAETWVPEGTVELV